MSDLAFLQFAEEMAELIADNDPSEFYPAHVSDLRTAECHARLLAHIEAWANLPELPSDDPLMAIADRQGATTRARLKAHVRALLAQSEEQKR